MLAEILFAVAGDWFACSDHAARRDVHRFEKFSVTRFTQLIVKFVVTRAFFAGLRKLVRYLCYIDGKLCMYFEIVRSVVYFSHKFTIAGGRIFLGAIFGCLRFIADVPGKLGAETVAVVVLAELSADAAVFAVRLTARGGSW